MDRYDEIIKEMDEFEKMLKTTPISREEAADIKMKMGDLADEARRLTCHISMCVEDNYV